ncbi:MAG: hypothetical protein JWP38_3706 [Herbaspirillum sp.]|nr:hypothetical protein [Herbaspirillum sp.]
MLIKMAKMNGALARAVSELMLSAKDEKSKNAIQQSIELMIKTYDEVADLMLKEWGDGE